MNKYYSEYDQRQIALMKEIILLYDRGHLDLGGLISKLESLFLVLENQHVVWATDFWKEWDVLESVYSDILDEEGNKTLEDHQYSIKNAVKNLGNLILDI